MNLLSKNGALFLLVLLLVPQLNANADSYALSDQSKNKIMIAAAIGGTICGGFGYLAYLDGQARNSNEQNDKKSFWGKIAPLIGYVMIPATLGAAAAGLITYYCFTPEKTQEWCDNTLKGYEFELKDIENCTDINQLKKTYYNARFPTVATFDRLDDLNRSLKNIREYVISVMKSGIEPLVTIAQVCLEKIDRYQKVLVDRLISLKNDPVYLKELLVRAEIRTMNEIANAQERMARAATTQAHAAMTHAQAALIQAQKPQVVVVHTRN